MSVFYEQVWRALKKIPRGRITTYREIAAFLGRPGAARAVGRACHKNPGAPQTPCHRVVKSDGSLGGYAGGVKAKLQLLKKEGIEAAAGKIREFKTRLYRFK